MIDAELSIKYLNELKEEYIDGEGFDRHPLPEYYAIEDGIEALHKVLEQQPCKGEWIRHTRVENVYDIKGVKTWGIKHQCNKCSFTTIAIEDFGYYDFCPHCGADMRGKNNE